MPSDLTFTVRDQILYLLKRDGPMTDEQLVALMPDQPESSVRTRRVELTRLGHVTRLGLVTNERGRPVGMYKAVA